MTSKLMILVPLLRLCAVEGDPEVRLVPLSCRVAFDSLVVGVRVILEVVEGSVAV